jgi:circadian clock protein KaiC
MRTSSGVDGIDALIEGGFPTGSAVLVAGEAGSGKSIFGLQFILSGIRDGEPGVIATTDMPERVLDAAASLGWDLRGAVEDGYARVVELPAQPLLGEGAGASQPSTDRGRRGNPPMPDAPEKTRLDAGAAVTRIRQAVQEIGAARLVLDRPQPLLASPEEAARYVAALVRSANRETGCTTLVTGQRAHDAGGYTALGIEEQVVDGIIDLTVLELAGRRSRRLAIRAMHGTAIDLDDHGFTILKGRGVVLTQ